MTGVNLPLFQLLQLNEQHLSRAIMTAFITLKRKEQTERERAAGEASDVLLIKTQMMSVAETEEYFEVR